MLCQLFERDRARRLDPVAASKRDPVEVRPVQREHVDRALTRRAGAHVAKLTVQDLVRAVPVPEEVYELAVRMVQCTRAGSGEPLDDVTEWLQWGAGPRAGQVLILGAKARALLHGRFHAAPEDLRALAVPALRHRLVPGFAAAARGITSEILIDRLLKAVAPA